MNKIPTEKKSEIEEKLKTFKMISVREKKGAEIIKELIGRDVSVILDPTLLLSQKEWKRIERKPKYAPKMKYILVYALSEKSDRFKAKIEQIKKEQKWEVLDVVLIQKNGRELPIGPAEFIYLIRNAEMILSDSFHATVFSIIFHKKFITFNRPGVNMYSRIESLAELFELDACLNKNKDVRKRSSSGGVFSALADEILSMSGVIYGVAMSEDCYSAEFSRVTDQAGLEKLRGSKYLQAKVGNTFKQVKEDLEQGKQVLFSGTGCQINGLKNFLQKEYEKLLCVDVICHGVPSPALWKKYVNAQEEKYGKLRAINFRYKDDWWKDFEKRKNQVYILNCKDSFMNMFLRDECLRPSCYVCTAKKEKNQTLQLLISGELKRLPQSRMMEMELLLC